MEHFEGRILIIDDDPNICRFYNATFSHAGFLVDVGESLADLKELLKRHSYDGVLLDLSLEKEYGLDGLPFILKQSPYTKVFVLTAHSTVENAVECMQRGATSFLTKGSKPEAIVAEVKRHLTADPIGDKSANLREFIIGESPAVHEVIETIEKVKDVDSTVLILGESGTGKEVVARTIHHTSARNQARFAAINCGAIPENLLESELFGHKRGAFTDAKTDRKGIFELCHKGTLLLDEIGDMPITLQTKLLRVLQERQITPVGSATAINIDTRVIAATHRDIYEEVKQKRFREDLFFRLSVVVIRIPPLRQRLSDIPILINHFLEQFNHRFSKSIRTPSKPLLSRLMAYHWPGNIRELQNAVERGVVLAKSDELDIKDMFQHLYPPTNQTAGNSFQDQVFHLPLTEAKQVFEKEYLENLLKDTHGNISEVARRSGRYRADIYRLMERYGFEQGQYR
jgi:DNA-binding NtrC family response regulator